ncbi:MAG: POTRA domain-containing protein [Parafilimonas sp.]
MSFSDSVSVSSKTDTSSLIFIAGIALYGNKKTKPYIIEREIPFKQGDYVLRKDLKEKLLTAKHQIINTGLFLETIVSVENQFGDLVFISVSVKEKWYLYPLPYFKLADRNFNEWWVTHKASLSRVNYGIKFQYNNVSGRNDRTILWLISGYSRQIAFKYERPYIDKALKNGFNIYFNYSKQKEINFKTDSNTSKQVFIKLPADFIKQTTRVSADYVYRPAIKTRHIFRFAYMNERVDDSVLKANPAYFPQQNTHLSFPEISYILQYNNTDYYAYPTKGFQYEASLMQRGFTKDFNLTQLQFTGSYTLPVAPKSQFQFQLGTMLKLPFSQPYYNKQLFGYGNIFLQGLEYYVIDGVAGAAGRFTARTQAVSFVLKSPSKVQKQIALPVRIFAKAYTNAGYAYNEEPGITFLNNRWLITGGFGADVVITYDIVFKFDYSFNQFGESGLFIHVRRDF